VAGEGRVSTDVAQIFGVDLAVAEWRKGLVCSRKPFTSRH
jgi:hypothetical protein